MLKRTPFKAKGFEPRPVKTLDTYVPRPRAAAVAVRDDSARLVVPVPKFEYVRDERLRDMCRAMVCQHCGRGGPDAGVTWAHSNQAIHGKGHGIKASDIYVAAMCAVCHRELDQGKEWGEAVKVAVWTAAHRRTKLHALANGLWPRDIPCPGYENRQPSAPIKALPTTGETSMDLQPHQQRVVDEKTELDDRLQKLVAFFGTPIYAGLPEAERQRLRCQSFFMMGYTATLNDRIEAFAA